MKKIEVRINDQKTDFQPTEWIEGRASWNLASPPRNIEIRLLWFTEGKGTTDLNIVETVTLGAEFNRSSGDASFRFQLPAAPYSFSGTLISLLWAIEVVVLPENLAGRADFVLAPAGKEIELRPANKPQSELEIRFRARKDAFLEGKGSRRSVEPKPMDSENPSPWS